MEKGSADFVIKNADLQALLTNTYSNLAGRTLKVSILFNEFKLD